jgi:bifunctional UDP-N-acetylglucosamine pyrophosphorylase/glucosamine-1-phosphate N-acetyltransferase
MTNDRAKPKLTAILLAAGQGTRMKSAKPKVLHKLCGRPMIHFVVDAAFAAGASDVVVVVGHGREEVSAYLAGEFGDKVRTVVQETQLGTGHAARCALPALTPEAEWVFVGSSCSAATHRSSTRPSSGSSPRWSATPARPADHRSRC